MIPNAKVIVSNQCYHMKLPLILPLIIAFGCSKQSKLEAYYRLEGEWSCVKGEERFVETWQIVNDTVMKGTSFMTLKKDTVFTENLELVYTQNGIYYTPTIPDQNEGAAIRFKLSKRTDDQWVFENKQHDFPSEIIYLFKGKDSLIATVQGIQNGRSQKIEFRLKKK